MNVKEYVIENSNGWVVKNLKKWGNSVFPANLIRNEEDVEAFEKLLSEILHNQVKLFKTEGGYICECYVN